MRKLHSRTHLQEQLQPLRNRQVIAIAIFINGLPLDELHHEIRSTIVGRTSIEQACDVRVIKAGQDLALVLESGDDERRILAYLHEFDGYLFLILVVCADSS